MFLLNSNHGNDPVSFPDHPFFHFPTPPFDDDDDDTLLLLQQPQHDSLLVHYQYHQPSNETPAATFVNMVDFDSNKIHYVAADADHVLDHHHHHENSLIMDHQIQRKRVSTNKRDRHSKINTLRGPRDRRMRLSLPVAREFFGLQDMLGVDKASKTVEWLLFQSRHAIKKLSQENQISCPNNGCGGGGGDAKSVSSISDNGEVVSGIDETIENYCEKRDGQKTTTTTTKEKRGRVTRKATFRPLARECREKARARARARTREKHLQISRSKLFPLEKPKPSHDHDHDHDLDDEATKQYVSKTRSTQMETTGEEESEQLETQTNDHHHQQQMFDNGGSQADSLTMIMAGRPWSSSNSIYPSLHLHNNNNNNNNNIGIIIPQEHHQHTFGDYQFLGKPWEPYNNHGLC